MTEYFEIHARDGSARFGELRLSTPEHTPTLADDIIVNSGSEWLEDQSRPVGSEDHVVVLPHRGFPSGTDPRIQSAFFEAGPDVSVPSATVVTPKTAQNVGADVYVLSTAQGLMDHAKTFVDAIIETRNNIPSDTALYLSGVATPRNAAVLIYAGVDLLDKKRAVIKGSQGLYLTQDDERPITALTELPCGCPACDTSVEDFTRELCIEHNKTILSAELARIRDRIKNGRLRDYIEAQARFSQWGTGVFREFDQEWDYIEERTPVARRTDISATSDDTMRRAEIRRFADRVTSRYVNRFEHPLVLVPCSARKPYSSSQSHKQFQEAVRWRGHFVSISSPVGIVPRELELTYPAQHYDTVVTGRWSQEEIRFVSDILEKYLSGAEYSTIIAHVPDGGYADIVREATDAIDTTVTFTVADHPTTEGSLAALDEELTGVSQYGREERYQNIMMGVADYQFGSGAGEALFGGSVVRGRYPKLRVFNESNEQIAALVPEYGLLALTVAGAKRWVDSDVSVHTVDIDEFVPHGSVLAPGVRSASPTIRVGDEVVVRGPRAFGVGRAAMRGAEMTESTRGIAVDVRHVVETE